MKAFAMIFSLLLLMSCSRSMNQVWHDTKTAGKYLFFGSKDLSEQYASNADFFPNFEEEFVPLEETPITSNIEPPQSKIEPGEVNSGVPGIDGFIKPVGSLATVFQRISFGLNDISIKQASSSRLDAVVDYLKKHKNVYVFVEGHCCERGSAQYNLSLGAKRAGSVRAYLVKRGIDPNRIFTISYGLERPFDSGHSEEAYRKNRRVEFKVFER